MFKRIILGGYVSQGCHKDNPGDNKAVYVGLMLAPLIDIQPDFDAGCFGHVYVAFGRGNDGGFAALARTIGLGQVYLDGENGAGDDQVDVFHMLVSFFFEQGAYALPALVC